ncbi:type II toxin-antitoxin system VapC family toxin [Microbacterium sp. MPKO10]|uniref:type II toxin-antitoxin system VapC family toxin n=1 Tax=Microbacterium sp. MPKO10 TaxID=2989818 RepID=UPI0022354F77|nr:type II toxin-antitoxin system VapC family toxin [Microbacterium sp. MPKO10]MCW4457834.1 type II toxin-antitoxin system VapC family toxin [Microbacterium sp. MPKO10]
MFLLDTNVISETRLPQTGNRAVLTWIDSIEQEHLFLSAITEYELELGVLMKERKDGQRAPRHRRWLEGVRDVFADRILPVHPETARLCAGLNVPDRLPFADALIAATALQRGLTVVTRNERDFDVPELAVLNPFH